MLALTTNEGSPRPPAAAIRSASRTLMNGIGAFRQAGLPGVALSLLAAQAISMSALNFFEMPGWTVAALVPAFTVFLTALIARSDVRLPSLPWPRHVLAIAIAAALSLPRLPYILEPVLGFAVNAVVSDDWWHFQEVAALAYTPTYPAVSTFSPDHLLGFYYAAWMLPAALFKISHGLLTVASAYGIAVTFYNLVFAYWVTYAATMLFKGRVERRIFTVLGFGFSGFAAISALLHPATLFTFPSGAESWPSLLGFNAQYSSFATLALWTPHHLVACLAALTAGWVMMRDTDNPIMSSVLAGGLFTFAAFASIFATIGAIPVLLCFVIARRRWLQTGLAVLSTFAFSAPLVWIYLGHSSGASGFALFGALSAERLQQPELALFLFTLVLTAQFGVLLAGAWRASIGQALRRSVATAALLFLGSTFAIAFVGFNNYAGRGSTASVLALAWVATPALARWWQSHRGWAIVVAITWVLGSALSLASVTSTSITALQASDTAFNRAVLTQNLAREGYGTPPSTELSDDLRWYLVENHLNDPKRTLLPQDLEVMVGDTPLRVTAPWLVR